MKHLLMIAALVLVPELAFGLVVCKTPDGQTYAGDTPPPKCVVTQTFTDAAAIDATVASTDKREAKDNAFAMHANIERRRIESEINEAADRLLKSREAIAYLDHNSPDYYTWTKERTDEYWATRYAYVTKEADARQRIIVLRGEFSNLTDSVRAHFGAVPATWRTSINCRDCP